jgi:hypothetical protein
MTFQEIPDNPIADNPGGQEISLILMLELMLIHATIHKEKSYSYG